MQKTNIPRAIAQEVLASAANAAEKGLSQFFTPLAFGSALATALPKHRQVLVDLNCGNSQLLQASANASTVSLLGSDIDHPKIPETFALRPSRIQYDVTRLYPLLVEVDWRADLFVLNPPWRLLWYRDRLAALAESECVAVRRAFQRIEPGLKRGTIDSTAATLMIALDRCTSHGEGLLIANNNTLERLIFGAGAPHSDLARHCWARVIVPGNPMTGIDDCAWQEGEPFETGVIYFAREHLSGPKLVDGSLLMVDGKLDLSTLNSQLSTFRQHRLGAAIRNEYALSSETYPRWQMVKDRVGELKGNQPQVPWNLWLAHDGTIRTGLSSFESHSRRLNKNEAKRLFDLNGKAPMQLVLQRADRDELLHVADAGGWRVQPELRAAVAAAIQSYHAARAPLYPLPDIMRLGYCDEHDWLECKKDLSSAEWGVGNAESKNSAVVFRRGKRYPLRTQTVGVERKSEKPNSTTGEPEEFHSEGQELAIYLHGAEWVDGQKLGTEHREYAFLDARLRDDPETKIHDARRTDGAPLPPTKVDYTLQELVEHFEIPAVPDVATVNPAGYQRNLDLLTQLEETLATL